MDQIYMNAMYDSPNRTGQRKLVLGVILCLGLLSVFLLVGLITLGFYYFSTTERNLTGGQQASDLISSLTEERDQLKANVTVLSQELERLQNASKHKQTCPPGWKMFERDCYLFSTGSASWEQGSQDCKEKQADLVIIDSYEEQVFLSVMIQKESWIGLSDRDHEGTWTWMDGTPLNSSLKFWGRGQPDNGGGDRKWGEEDCTYLRTEIWARQNWNDLSCDGKRGWICEKMAEH